ncbi:unnamed protein product [Rotaria magnacalcarata]|uniref:Uncharacterized protein n=1 Tax=Rotaria magnacalcarata TaxID=392030 RepID=A0A816B3K0_9BILA|nr:unnamed protein product [Rotaria magnacalcarata]CAF1603687.1 unnamed protein product [Rotaria magnacalcarata]CAF2048122.1 unnamed protein product [Rotaria magnacalcarata]CAF2139981.1 unnamed protein product [Rotaria magnacalcarata]CAF3781074.1 unnamed protein product [Rotaria magnacalcarata]
MHGYSIVIIILISLLPLINGQQELDSPHRISKSAFNAQFYRGQCPDRFYQIGNECLYFGTDGRKYSPHQIEYVCATQIARLVERQTTFVIGQVNIKPKKGVRQLVLNTPEKGKLLEALYREYDELNFAVRLPSDYDKLNRCHDDKDDNWPQYCINLYSPNATCFETNGQGSIDVCLGRINCALRHSRLACEFTIPGSAELTASSFRHCPIDETLHRSLSVWAWLLVLVGGLLLLLLILGGVLTLIRSSKKASTQTRKSVPITHREAVNIRRSRSGTANEQMLVRAARVSASDPDYLEPIPLKTARQDSISLRV